MRPTRSHLALCLALGILAAGPALAKDPKPERTLAEQDQAVSRDTAPLLILETDHSAEEAKESLQGQSHDRGDGGHGGPSAGFGGMGPSHGGGPGPHR